VSLGLHWAWVRIAVFIGILCPLISLSWARSQGTAWATTPGEGFLSPHAVPINGGQPITSEQVNEASAEPNLFPLEVHSKELAAGKPGQEKAPTSQLEPPAIVIPRLVKGPTIDEFLSMKPEGEVARRMTRVSGFVQRDPHDGEPVTQKTEAYLGYDNNHLYEVFICFD